MFRIVKTTPTDYEPSEDRAALQAIADELNNDAAQEDCVDHWHVVEFEPTKSTEELAAAAEAPPAPEATGEQAQA